MDSRAANLRSRTSYSANSARNGLPIHVECAVDKQTPTYIQTITANKVCSYKVDVRRRLLIAALLLVPICLVTIGVSRLVVGLNDYTIDTWRIVLLFANVFGCVAVLSALYARGRASARRPNIGRRR
jgi:hypothetical protein